MASIGKLDFEELKRSVKPKVQPLVWDQDRKVLLVLDQRKLPHSVEYFEAKSPEDVYYCIREMLVRGAPAIGIAGAYGLALAAYRLREKTSTPEELYRKLVEVGSYLKTARPTAVNLEWAIDTVLMEVKRKIDAGEITNVRELVNLTERCAVKIQEEEFELELKIAIHGLQKLEGCSAVMTQCNAGGLAGAGLGTALAPIKLAKYLGIDIKVYVPETRPWLQGARLTVYELRVEGIPHVLITDTAVGYVMYRGLVDAVIVGADRILRDGHVINKIGTFKEAVIAHELGIPFYVAAPKSTFDLKRSIEEVIIEERDPDEVRKIRDVLITLPDTPVYNPVFDITPPKYVTAIITELGVIHPPYHINIPRMLTPHASEK